MVSLKFAACATRREASQTNRRESIVEVAKESFMEHGYAGTTMSHIAEVLGGSKGTLWKYFPSKDLLFAAVVDRATQEFRAQLTPMLSSNDETAVVLMRFAREYLQKLTSPQAVALQRMVVCEAKRFPELGRIFYERAAGRTGQLLANYLAMAMQRGALIRCDPQVVASQLLGLCAFGWQQQILLGLVEHADPAHIERDAELGVTAFMRAYASR